MISYSESASADTYLYMRLVAAMVVGASGIAKAVIFGKLFYGCEKLTSLDVSNFNTSNVTDMRSMFSSCSAVNSMKEGELSSWELHPSVSFIDFCKGTKFEKTPTALFKNRGRSVWESLKSSLK